MFSPLDLESGGVRSLATIYGFLHTLSRSGKEEPIIPATTEKLISEICASERVFGSYEGGPLGVRNGWDIKSFNSPKPMMGEDEEDLLGGPYPYPFYVFVNKVSGNVIVGSLRYTISNAVIEHLNFFLSRRANRTLQRISFDIEAIRQAIEEGLEEGLFATLVQLDVNDFSSNIQSISISGDDVLGVDFLSRFDADAFRARQIGLRVSSSFAESCRLQKGGEMQFYSDRLRDLELCLGSVYRNSAIVFNY